MRTGFSFTLQHSVWMGSRSCVGCWGHGIKSTPFLSSRSSRFRAGVEQGRRYPRKICNKMLTSLVKTGLRMYTTEGQTHVAGGGLHTEFPEEVILQDAWWEHALAMQKSKKKNSRALAVSMQRLAEAGKFREMQSHGWRVVCGWCRARDGTGTGSRGEIWSSDLEGPGKATVVVKQGLTSQACGLEAALWLLHGGRISGA